MIRHVATITRSSIGAKIGLTFSRFQLLSLYSRPPATLELRLFLRTNPASPQNYFSLQNHFVNKLKAIKLSICIDLVYETGKVVFRVATFESVQNSLTYCYFSLTIYYIFQSQNLRYFLGSFTPSVSIKPESMLR